MKFHLRLGQPAFLRRSSFLTAKAPVPVNAGLPEGDRIVNKLAIDPKDGAVYALLTGNGPDFRNAGETGIYRMPAGGSRWESLRGEVRRPAGVEATVARIRADSRADAQAY